MPVTEPAENPEHDRVEQGSAGPSNPLVDDESNPSGNRYVQAHPVGSEPPRPLRQIPTMPAADVPDLLRPRPDSPEQIPAQQPVSSRTGPAPEPGVPQQPISTAQPITRHDQADKVDFSTKEERMAAPESVAPGAPGRTEGADIPQTSTKVSSSPAAVATQPTPVAPQPNADQPTTTQPAAAFEVPAAERQTTVAQPPETLSHKELPPASAPAADATPAAAAPEQRPQAATPSGQTLQTLARAAIYPEPDGPPAGTIPKAGEAEIPQVRIGRINVLIEDQAAPRPRAKSAPAAPAAGNPFGLRGL
jgi:hypothetical protein